GYMELGRVASRADSFDFVFNAHRDYIYSLTRALLGNAQDAEDVTQDVFLRVYRALPSYKPERASMRTWLTTLAVNACNTHRRRNFLHRLWGNGNGHNHHDGNGDGDADGVLELADPSILGAPEEHALQSELRRAVN